MKRTLIGQISLIGSGFYPSKILERILALPWISRESPKVIEEDFNFFRRMKIQNFKDGFTWILPSGSSFFIQLKGQKVYLYAIEKALSEQEPTPALPADDLQEEELASLLVPTGDTETIPEVFELEDLEHPPLPPLPATSEQAQGIEVLEISSVIEMAEKDLAAEENLEKTRSPGSEEFTVRLDGHGQEVRGQPTASGFQLEFSFEPESGLKTPAEEAPGELESDFFPQVLSARGRTTE